VVSAFSLVAVTMTTNRSENASETRESVPPLRLVCPPSISPGVSHHRTSSSSSMSTLQHSQDSILPASLPHCPPPPHEEDSTVETVVTPPLRAPNPITMNSPFATQKRVGREGAEIGLLSFSPPPPSPTPLADPDLFERRQRLKSRLSSGYESPPQYNFPTSHRQFSIGRVALVPNHHSPLPNQHFLESEVRCIWRECVCGMRVKNTHTNNKHAYSIVPMCFDVRSVCYETGQFGIARLFGSIHFSLRKCTPPL
jgi:hypothetical protein